MDKQVVTNEIIKLDYGTFENMAFRSCKLIFEGGRPPSIVGCEFDRCEFIFEGPALNTLSFLAGVARGGGGGAELVVNILLGLDNWVRK